MAESGRVLGEIAAYIGATVRGDPTLRVYRLNTLKDASAGELSFFANSMYHEQLAQTRAAAVILSAADAGHFAGDALIADDAYVAYARATALFVATPRGESGVHPSAVIHPAATVAASAAIGAHVTIGAGALIGERVVLGPGTSVGTDSVIGPDCRIAANVTIYHNVRIGERVVIHSGAVLGADGFGFANDGERWVKIHQLGGVVIGDGVEIGACTTIDRGALGDTVIEAGVILDNHVQIGHNVRLGENTAMAAYAAIAGSTTVGKNCIFAGQSGAVGHVSICDNVIAHARCTLSKSITRPGAYSADLLMDETPQWRRNAARFRHLDEIARRLKKLENKISDES
ncbi:MAG: UDP-3-O-(3-hydroxymyristoyl)glucosamine N-acyltransferase [Porticoccaceae bacterium]